MKTKFFIALITLLLIPLLSFSQASSLSTSKISNKSGKIHVSAEATVDVTPDIIKVQVNLNDTIGNNSIEELESTLNKILNNLEIDSNNDVSLKDTYEVVKNGHQYNFKEYEIVVHSSSELRKLFGMLRENNIPSAFLSSVSFSQKEEVLDKLRVDAILKAQTIAKSLADALNQKMGKAVIVDCSSSSHSDGGFFARKFSNCSDNDDNINDIDIKKITIKQSVSAIFELKKFGKPKIVTKIVEKAQEKKQSSVN